MEIDKFNKTIDYWIDELSRYSIEQLLIKPDNKSWSLGQVYEHLIEDSNWYNSQIKLALASDAYATIETSDKAKELLERGSFENKKIKGVALNASKVKQPTSVSQLKSDMENLKNDTNMLWDEMQITSSNGKAKHPGFGYFNCFEWLAFSEMHMRHHVTQKENIDRFLDINQ
ncbi:DinB family protein [Chondrinema litorale]|uniref:DinB family protein n=1 Tax=Chondrinema litorale TaxID=2994555 RepID=UPI00254336FA|nr:DinB family protein [Chondrinema litorale]UZR97177.1 DinB family protein [Chondrinema litorale]